MLLTVGAFSITGLLFEGVSGYGAVAALAASTIVQITMMTTNSILYGLGKQRVSMRHTLIGLFLKIGSSVALAPLLGVYGLIIGSVICFVVVTALNLRWINGLVKLNVLGKRWAPYILAVAVSSLAGWGAERGVLAITDGWAAKLSYLTAAVAAGLAVGILYGSLLILLKVITPEDVNSLPAMLRRPFSRVMKLLYRSKPTSA